MSVRVSKARAHESVDLEIVYAHYGWRHPAVDVGDIFMKTTEIPGTISKINTAVSGLQKSRGSMKRSMVKTQQEIKLVQYSVVCALLAEKFGDNPPLAMFFVFCTLWFTFRKSR